MKPFYTSRHPKNLRKALKHHKRLGVLKLILIGCVGLVFFFVFWESSFFKDRSVVVQDEIGRESSPEHITEKHILNAKFEGVDDQNRPFKVIAKSANQVSENQIDLMEPKGEIVLTDGDKMTLEAASGILTDDNMHLDLKGDVHFNYGECSVETQKAHANLSDKTVRGGQVSSSFSQGVVEAGGFLVDHTKGVLTYTNRPHLVIHKGQKSYNPVTGESS